MNSSPGADNDAEIGNDATSAPDPWPLLLGAEWPDDVPGGLNRYFADLMGALAADGRAEPSAVVVGPAEDRPLNVFSASTWTTPLPRRLERFAEQVGRLVGAADLVEAHFALYAFAALGHANVRARPLVVHFHGPWAEEATSQRGTVSLASTAKALIERIVYRRADAIVVLSDAFAELVVDRYGVDPDRVTVMEPGVDVDRFTPGDQVWARTSLGLPEDGFVVVSARRLVPRMGLGDLIEAWTRTEPSAKDRLVIIGQGPERESLERQARASDCADTIVFTGRISDDELVAHYRAANLAAVPSRELEGFGLVTLEAAACGTPTLATDVGGLGPVTRGLDPDLVVPPYEPVSLAAALDRARAGELPDAAACRAYAERFSWSTVAAKRRKLWASLMPQPAALSVGSQVRPRVVFLTHTAEPSGAELALMRLVSALGDKIDSHVIVGAEGPLTDLLEERSISYEVFPLAGQVASARRETSTPLAQAGAASRLVRHGSALAKRLKELDPHLVHSSSLKSHIYGGWAARRLGVPIVWYLHDRIAPDYLPAPTVRLLRKLAATSPAGIGANSHASLATLPRSKGPRKVIGCVVEPPTAAQPREASADFTVGVFGRLAPWKGQNIAMAAFAEAFAGDPTARCRIVGAALFDEEEWGDQLKQLAGSLGIADQVDFVGHRQDIDAEYARVDVVVHASTLPEPFGQVIVEAQAAARPVVAAAAGGVIDLVSDGVDGLLYAPGDAGALADCLRRLRRDPGLAQHLAAAGPKAASRFTGDAVADQTLVLYREVLERHQARQP